MKAQSPALMRTYAKALLDISPEESTGQHLKALQLLSKSFEHPPFKETMGNPVIPSSDKEEVLCTLLEHQGLLDQNLQRWIRSIVDKKRILLLQHVWMTYENLLYQRRKKIKALVVTAFPFSGAFSKEIHQQLERIWKKPVDIEYRKDPSIVGGMQVYSEDQVLDLSVQGQLENIRRLLISEER